MDNDFIIDQKIREKLLQENSEVPQSIHQLIHQTHLIESKSRPGRRYLKYLLAASLLLVVGFTFIKAILPAFLPGTPVHETAFKAVTDMQMLSDYQELSSNLNVSSTSKGYKVSVQDIGYDGVTLSMSFSIASKTPLTITPNGVKLDCTINGKEYGPMLCEISYYSLSEDKRTFNGIMRINAFQDFMNTSKENPGMFENPHKFKLKVNIEEFFETNNENKTMRKLSGNWKFNALFESKKMKGKVRNIDIAIPLNKLVQGIAVNRLVVAPLNTVLQGTFKEKTLIGMAFFAFDDKGRELKTRYVVHGKDFFMYGFDEVNPSAKEITFIPYIRRDLSYYQSKGVKTPGETVTADLNMYGSTLISLGTHGKMEITQVEVTQGKTNIYFKSPFGLDSTPIRIVEKTTKRPVDGYTSMGKYVEDRQEYMITVYSELTGKAYQIECRNPEFMNEIHDSLKFSVALDK